MPGRNEPCPCGSGKKFKHCHLVRAQPTTGITPDDRDAAFADLDEHDTSYQAFWDWLYLDYGRHPCIHGLAR